MRLHGVSCRGEAKHNTLPHYACRWCDSCGKDSFLKNGLCYNKGCVKNLVDLQKPAGCTYHSANLYAYESA